MFGSAPFGRLLYSGSPVEKVERGAAATFAVLTSVLIISIAVPASSSLAWTASASPSKFFRQASASFTFEASTPYIRICTSGKSVLEFASSVYSFPRARSFLTIQAQAQPTLRSVASAILAFFAQCTPSQKVYLQATSSFGLAARAQTPVAATISFTFLTKAIPTSAPYAIWELRLLTGDIDLSHRVKSWSMQFNFDAGAWSLDVEFTNHAQLVEAGFGLAPWDPISIYNEESPLLGGYHEVKFYVRKEGAESWFLLFNGFAGPSTVEAGETWGEADTVRATFIGPSQPLKDWQIEERLALRYRNAPLAKVSYPNDLLNRIVKDQGFSYTIEYQDEPSYYVTEYIISNVSLWAALENALAPTGFRLIESLDLTDGGLSLKVVDPLRFKTTPDRVLPYFYARRITSHEADVRTWAGVIYRDRNDFQEKLVWATSSPAILEKYGIPDGGEGRKHKKMVYRTSDRSLVDTESEARELASMILWDLETPSPAVEITIPWLDLRFWPFQLLEVVGENITTLVGVQEIEWNWSWERPCGSTVIRGSEGRVVGARGLWFARDSRRGFNRELQDLEKLSETARSLQPGKPTVVGAWFQHEDGSPKPVIDVILAEPPSWAKGVLLKIYRFSFLDSGVVSSASGAVITLDGKSYPSGRYRGACRDYLLVSSGDLESRMWRIKTVSGANVTLEKEPEALPQAGDEVILARLRSLQTKAYPLCRFIRLEDVTEGELLGVSYAWKTR